MIRSYIRPWLKVMQEKILFMFKEENLSLETTFDIIYWCVKEYIIPSAISFERGYHVYKIYYNNTYMWEKSGLYHTIFFVTNIYNRLVTCNMTRLLLLASHWFELLGRIFIHFPGPSFAGSRSEKNKDLAGHDSVKNSHALPNSTATDRVGSQTTRWHGHC